MSLTRLLLLVLLALTAACVSQRDDEGDDETDYSDLVTCMGDYAFGSDEFVDSLISSGFFWANIDQNIDPEPISTLSDIAHCEVIEGTLVLYDTPLTDLDELSSLVFVKDGLFILANSALTNIGV